MTIRTSLVLVLAASCSVDVPRLSQPEVDAGGDVGDPDATLDAALDGSPDSGPLPTGLVLEAPVQWRSGDFPAAAGARAERFCFLQIVQGKLKAAGEELGVTIVGENWLVNGVGSDQLVQVRCLAFAAASGLVVSQRFTWSETAAQADPPVDMGPASDRICALTRVAGVFNGGGELLHAAIQNGRWQLSGTSGAAGVTASAHCLVFPAATAITYSGETNWAQGQPAATLEPDDGRRACVFALIVGSFLGGGEHVDITSTGGAWTLSGGSGQLGVAARARCVAWP